MGFCSQNTLAPLQHHPRPSPPSGLQLGLSALLPSVPGGLAAPGGDFVTDTSGWGGEGQGVRHEGWGRGVCAIEKILRMGRGGGHPSMSQLKRWCFTSMSCTPSFSGFFSFSCRTTQRRGQCTTPRKGEVVSVGGAQARRGLWHPDRAASCTSHLCAAGTRRGPVDWRALGKGSLPFPSAPAGQGRQPPLPALPHSSCCTAYPGRESSPIHSLWSWLQRRQRMG